MPDEPREIRIKRPASQIHCSRCLSFIPRHRTWRKQAFTELDHTSWNGNTCCLDGSGGTSTLAREVGDVHVGQTPSSAQPSKARPLLGSRLPPCTWFHDSQSKSLFDVHVGETPSSARSSKARLFRPSPLRPCSWFLTRRSCLF